MEIEDAFTEEAVGTLSTLDEDDQQELRRIAGELYATNQIVDVEQTIDVCVLFFAAGGIYQDAKPITVEMTLDEYVSWAQFVKERDR